MSKDWMKFERGSREDFLKFTKTLEPHHHLRILFRKNEDGCELIDLLKRLPRGSQVSYLSLEGTIFLDRDLARLSHNPRFSLTNGLHLGNCGFTDRGLARFVQTPLVRGLKELYLDNRVSSKPERINKIGDFAAHALAQSPQLETLQKLGFWKTDLGDNGLRALIESSYLPKLSSICAWSTRVTEEFHHQISALKPGGTRRYVHTDYNIPAIDYFGGDYE